MRSTPADELRALVLLVQHGPVPGLVIFPIGRSLVISPIGRNDPAALAGVTVMR